MAQMGAPARGLRTWAAGAVGAGVSLGSLGSQFQPGTISKIRRAAKNSDMVTVITDSPNSPNSPPRHKMADFGRFGSLAKLGKPVS
jgi:DhnA family fructose-bisphosphate aldolase class Ia